MNETQLRKKLPISDGEQILGVVRHHWFAYVGIYLMTGLLVAVLAGCLVLVVVLRASLGIPDQMVGYISFGIVVFAVVAMLFSLIPLHIRRQEMLVITEESILQLEKPSLFSSKTSQLNLQHVADVTVHQDMIGSMLGYGKLSIETPGEQDNYEFTVVPDPQATAKKIIEAHENYVAALESGQIRTTLGQRPPVPGTAWRPEAEVPPTLPTATPPVPPSAPGSRLEPQQPPLDEIPQPNDTPSPN